MGFGVGFGAGFGVGFGVCVWAGDWGQGDVGRPGRLSGGADGGGPAGLRAPAEQQQSNGLPALQITVSMQSKVQRTEYTICYTQTYTYT